MKRLDQARIVFTSFVDHLLKTPRAELDTEALVDKYLPDFITAILDRQLLRPKQVEQFFPALNEPMLRNMRHRDQGPSYAKIGSNVYYRMADILSWVEKSMVYHR